MSNIFTIEDLKAEIETRYAPLVFKVGDQEFTLQSLLMVDEKVRAEVQNRLKSLTESADDKQEVSEADTIEVLKFVLSSVTRDRKGAALCRALGNSLVMYSTLMEKWQEATQPGEASNSPS